MEFQYSNFVNELQYIKTNKNEKEIRLKQFRFNLILTLFWHILGQKWIEKRPDLIFLESQDNLVLFSDNLQNN